MKPLVRSLLAFLVLLALPGGAMAAEATTTVEIVSNHDFDSATATYCLLGPLKDESRLYGRIQTTGSSATVDASGSGTPFTNVAAGDTIIVEPGVGAAPETRYVLTRASATQITINTAANWSGNNPTGYAWSYRHLTCGTGASDGWFSVARFTNKSINFSLKQLAVASGSVAVTVQCKAAGFWSEPVPVYPRTGAAGGQCDTGLFVTAGSTASCTLDLSGLPYSLCRVGVALTDDAGDLTTNLEQFTATLEGR